MKVKKGTIIGLLAMIIVLATSAVCLFGCGKSDDDDEEENE